MNSLLHLHALDWVVLGIALSATIIAGLSATRGDQRRPEATGGIAEYILAGRRLTIPMFAASLIATWYGSVLGAAEFVARYGVSFVLCFGVPYYIAAVVYALVLSKRLRRNDAVSIPDLIRRSYGQGAGYAAAIAMLFISIPAPFMLSVGLLISGLTGVVLPVGVVVGTIVALFIVAKGGLGSDVRANMVQVVLMFAGFGSLAVWCIVSYGSPLQMWSHVPTLHQNIPGTLGWQAIAVWFLIALQTFVDPNFHVRTAASHTPHVAQRGLMLSVAGWMVFDGLQLIIGLYALVYAPSIDPGNTLLGVANATLPIAWKGLLLAGVFAAVMSALDGYALVSATTIGHDVIDAVRGKGFHRSSLYTGLLVTGIVGVVAAIAIPSIVDLIYNAASVTVPALLLPIYAATRPRMIGSERIVQLPVFALWIVLPGVASLLTFTTNALLHTHVEPMITGIAVSAVMLPIIRVLHARETRKR